MVMINDDLRDGYSEGPMTVSKDFVFEKGDFFTPMLGNYDDTEFINVYVVEKDFTIAQVVEEFKDSIEPHSYQINTNTLILLEKMLEAGYIRSLKNSHVYNFGRYKFLGNPE